MQMADILLPDRWFGLFFLSKERKKIGYEEERHCFITICSLKKTLKVTK
jgi:hypothetical protein